MKSRVSLWTPVVLLLLLLLSSSSVALGKRSDRDGKGIWQILILDQTRSDESNQSIDWTTIWSDGNHQESFSQPVIAMGNRLFSLSIETRSQRATCSGTNLQFSYEIDQLVGTPVRGCCSKVLLGRGPLLLAKESLRIFRDECQSLVNRQETPLSRQTYENVHFNVLTLHQDFLGIETARELWSYGREHPVTRLDWHPYRIGRHLLSRLGSPHLTKDMEKEADRQFNELSPEERNEYGRLTNREYVFVPDGDGTVAEVLVPPAVSTDTSEPLIIQTKAGPSLIPNYQEHNIAFIERNPGLIPVKDVDAFTASPDLSSVVFIHEDTAFWKFVDGNLRTIGPVKHFRGWQWFKSKRHPEISDR